MVSKLTFYTHEGCFLEGTNQIFFIFKSFLTYIDIYSCFQPRHISVLSARPGQRLFFNPLLIVVVGGLIIEFLDRPFSTLMHYLKL